MLRRTAILLAFVVLRALPGEAQTVETDPLQCWWRTSTGAVRVGEPFSVVLTCAVLETDTTKVEPDQSKLEPSVVQLAPFEVLGGTHGADLSTDLRRFFQYEYRVRLLAENFFGKDVPLPETKLSYHVRSSVGQKTAIQGRDQTYVLPALSVRVLSLVPADATDIRDASTETFGDIDARASRAKLFVIIGGILFTIAVLLVRTGGWPRRKTVAVSGAVTARSMARERARGLGNARRETLLESLDQGIAQFTAAQYSRSETLDAAALDEALAAGRAAVRRIMLEQTWVMKKFGPRRPPREVEARAWSR